MTSVFQKLLSSSLLTLEHAMCQFKVQESLIHLSSEILQQIIEYLAPSQKFQRDEKDRTRKQAHQSVVEFLSGCEHPWTFVT
jgi:hypothetical protein